MKKLTLALGIVVAALAALAAPHGWEAWQERRGGGANPEIVTAAAVEPSIVALGEVLPVSDIVAVAAPSGQDVGRIAEVLVTEGADVERGAVIAVLDTLASRTNKRLQQEATVAQRRAAVEKIEADIASGAAGLEAQIAQQQAALDKLAAQIDRQARLTKSGVLDAASLADKRLDLLAAQAALDATKVTLKRTIQRGTDGLYIDVATAMADLSSAEANLASARDDEDKARIRAPISGRVLTLHARIGEQIGSEGFADIGDVSTMVVRAEVFETDIGGIRPGDAAVVTSRSLNGELTAKVVRTGTRITRQSITSTDPAETVDARVIEVWLELDSASSAKLRDFTGLQVTVRFKPKRDANA
jgi:HlyD family secretion protein